MKQQKVISYENLPTRLPVISTTVAWLLLDRANAPGWVWGAVTTIFVLWWVGSAVRLIREKQTDILKDAPNA